MASEPEATVPKSCSFVSSIRSTQASLTALPAHANPRQSAPILAKPKSQPTVGQLMTHTAGFSYGFTQDPVDTLYSESEVLG